MADYEEVLPRITDPTMKPFQKQEQPGIDNTKSIMNTAKGLFTSMYENKIIVAAIVIFIVIVLILAYFIMHKSDNKKSKLEKLEQGEKHTDSVKSENVNKPAKKDEEPQAKPPAPAPPKKQVDLSKLYKGIKDAAAKKTPEEEPEEEKTDDLTKFLRGDESDIDMESNPKNKD